ncbi:hypothetical protein [Actinospica robiniae]|uniref:hypothetical protein n=1 Tax=Actinospica robiniae TaxID=304901 RepID=UPI000413B9D8|nr:hypothetical protein [Actinospica robiniae]
MNYTAGLAPYHNMIMDLLSDGWNALADPFADRYAAATRTHLTCPANYLRLTLEMSSDAAVHCRLGIVPDGTGEPARWRASAAVPPAPYWLACARSAHQAVFAPRRANLFPGDVLTRIGWKQLHGQIATSSLRTVYSCPHGTSRISYQASQRAMPALWSITRQDASVGLLVNAAEPRALPALILALALTPTRGSEGCCAAQQATQPLM